MSKCNINCHAVDLEDKIRLWTITPEGRVWPCCFFANAWDKRNNINDIGPNSESGYLLKDTICAIHYRLNRSVEYHKKVFVTNRDKSSARQFLDWLQVQHYESHHFNIIAHNGSRFDNYFLVANFTENEQLQTDIQLRGTSIIGMQNHSSTYHISSV